MKKILIIPLITLFLVSCFAGQNTKPYSSMSPKEKSIFFMKIYDEQFDNYQIQSLRKNLTQEQIRILYIKRNLLTDIYPMISAYTILVNKGLQPSEKDADAIYDMIDQLITNNI